MKTIECPKCKESWAVVAATTSIKCNCGNTFAIPDEMRVLIEAEEEKKLQEKKDRKKLLPEECGACKKDITKEEHERNGGFCDSCQEKKDRKKLLPEECGACKKDITKEEHERNGGYCDTCIARVKKARSESWGMVPLSGIIPGVVMAVSKANMEGVSWILITGFAYAFCITNKNLCFGWTQRFVATAIMFVIGMYGMDILEAMKNK